MRAHTCARAAAALLAAAVLWSSAASWLSPTPCDMTYSHPVYTRECVRQLRLNGTRGAVCAGYRDRGPPLPPSLEDGSSRLAYKYALWRISNRGPPDAALRPGSVPVLYLPGHQGSHEQARSVTSALDALQRARAGAGNTGGGRVDVWVADFGGEGAATHTQALSHQAEFVNDAVASIRNGYARAFSRRRVIPRSGSGAPPPAPPPPPVVLLGHSLGGIAARRALVSHNFAAGSVSAVVTLGSPHAAPPVLVDPAAAQWYAALRGAEAAAAATAAAAAAAARPAGNCSEGSGDVCTAAAAPPGASVAIPLLSVSGGDADTHVWEGLSAVGGGGHASGSALAAAPVAWRSTQALLRVRPAHAALVWCGQLLQPIAAALERLSQDCGGASAEGGAGACGPVERLAVLTSALDGAAGVAEGSAEDAPASMAPRGNGAAAVAATAWVKRAVAWLLLGQGELALLERDVAGGRAATAMALGWLAGTPVRYGPAVAGCAVALALLAVAALAARAAGAPAAPLSALSAADALQPSALLAAARLPLAVVVGAARQWLPLSPRAAAGLQERATWAAVAAGVVVVCGDEAATPRLPLAVLVGCLLLASSALDAAAVVCAAARRALPLGAASTHSAMRWLAASVACALAPAWLPVVHRAMDMAHRAQLGIVAATTTPEEAVLAGWDAAAACVFVFALSALVRRRAPAPTQGASQGVPALNALRALVAAAAPSPRPAPSQRGKGGEPPATVPPSPAHSQASASSGDASPHTPSDAHAACDMCFHDGGGRTATLSGNMGGRGVVEVAPGVWIGPTYRVLRCDCATAARAGGLRGRELLEQLCDFCSCGCLECGGSPAAAAAATGDGGAEQVGASGGTGAVVRRALRVLPWVVRFCVSGSGDVRCDAAVVAVAFASAAAAALAGGPGNLGRMRGTVLVVLALCRGCLQSVLSAA